MNVRKYVIMFTLASVIIIGTFAATLATGGSPLLGLDLQGGLSVTLTAPSNATSDQVAEAVNIMRERVDSLGVAEPEISQQGKQVIVELPGVKDRNKALALIGQTAELRFRPVLGAVESAAKSAAARNGVTTTTAPTTAPGTPATTTVAAATTAPGTKFPEPTVAPTVQGIKAPGPGCPIYDLTVNPYPETTAPVNDRPDCWVVLPDVSNDRSGNPKVAPRLLLGPSIGADGTSFDGKDISSAVAQLPQQSPNWEVNLTLKDSGASKFDALAQQMYGLPGAQPNQQTLTNQVAFVLDGEVQSAPAFQQNSFGNNVSITGNFTSNEAHDLARVLNYGALPVKFDQGRVENVSPSLGADQLHAGIVAGLIGLALVGLYVLLYYRMLGLVIWLGMSYAVMATYSLVSYLGSSVGLTLTLSGVVGLIVSVGVAVDSYVVYFERLKDEVRGGRTVRTAADHGFGLAWRTILAADLVTLMSAVALYAFAIGSVRGFAFYLGFATLLDLAIAYFVMHPLVALICRRRRLVQMPHFGIAAGLDAKGVEI